MQPGLATAAALTAVLLAGCASGPAATASVPPFEVADAIERHLDQPVAWGGMVVETRNFDRYSEIELIAFPLDRHGRPLPHQRDLGRFILLRAGFLDPQIYAPGRFLTAHGRITGDRRGRIREAAYVWPELDADAIDLWPADFRARQGNVRFSIGIGIFR